MYSHCGKSRVTSCMWREVKILREDSPWIFQALKYCNHLQKVKRALSEKLHFASFSVPRSMAFCNWYFASRSAKNGLNYDEKVITFRFWSAKQFQLKYCASSEFSNSVSLPFCNPRAHQGGFMLADVLFMMRAESGDPIFESLNGKLMESNTGSSREVLKSYIEILKRGGWKLQAC